MSKNLNKLRHLTNSQKYNFARGFIQNILGYFYCGQQQFIMQLSSRGPQYTPFQNPGGVARALHMRRRRREITVFNIGLPPGFLSDSADSNHHCCL